MWTKKNDPVRFLIPFFMGFCMLPILGRSISFADSAEVTIDVSKSTGTFKTVLTTQLAYRDAPAASVSYFKALAPGSPVRIHMSSEDEDQPNLPEKVRGEWNFGPLDSQVNEITHWGGQVMLNPKFPPDYMWSCGSWQEPGTVVDGSFRPFGDYLARLVSYYNKGSMTTEKGETIVNPAGTRNRVDYWEIWNEPDLSDETPCKAEGREAAITPDEYVTMWNAVVPKMLAVDPTIKLVGPAVSGAHTEAASNGQYPQDYIPALMAGAVRKPDAISFHAYGGGENESTDLELFDGGGEAGGMNDILKDLSLVREWAPGIPVFITELNVNSSWKEDPQKRPWTALGTAWMCSAYYHLGALEGADVISQFVYWEENQQDSMMDKKTGKPTLSYWRDYYVTRYFPRGSTLLSTDSSIEGIEVMAARTPGSDRIRVMVINRRVVDDSDVGGGGVPTTVEVNLENSSDITGVTERLLDHSTPASGPPAKTLPADSTVKVVFSGYGVALLEFVPQTVEPR